MVRNKIDYLNGTCLDLLDSYIIRASTSPWSNPIFVSYARSHWFAERPKSYGSIVDLLTGGKTWSEYLQRPWELLWVLRDSCWLVTVGKVRALIEHIITDYTRTGEGRVVTRELFFSDSYSSSWTDRAAEALKPIIPATIGIPISLCFG